MIRNLTSEIAVKQVGSRYDLVIIASARMRQLRDGAVPRVPPELTAMSTALKEIELGLVGEEILTQENLTNKPLARHRRR